MKVAFKNVDPDEQDTICFVNVLPWGIELLAEEDGVKTKVFLHSLAKFVQWLDENDMINDNTPIEDPMMSQIVICGADIEEYSLTFRDKKFMNYKEIFTILKHYAEELDLEYPKFMDDIDESMYMIFT